MDWQRGAYDDSQFLEVLSLQTYLQRRIPGRYSVAGPRRSRPRHVSAKYARLPRSREMQMSSKPSCLALQTARLRLHHCWGQPTGMKSKDNSSIYPLAAKYHQYRSHPWTTDLTALGQFTSMCPCMEQWKGFIYMVTDNQYWNEHWDWMQSHQG